MENPFEPAEVPGYTFVGNLPAYNLSTKRNWTTVEAAAFVANDLEIPEDAVMVLVGMTKATAVPFSAYVHNDYSAVVDVYNIERKQSLNEILNQILDRISDTFGGPCDDPDCEGCRDEMKRREERR